MTTARPSVERPSWVKVGLFGVNSRGSALAFMWLCILIAPTCAYIAIAHQWPEMWAGLLGLGSAMWYWLCIRWVDEHDDWD